MSIKNPLWARVLELLYDPNIEYNTIRLARAIPPTTYSTIIIILKELESKNLLTLNRVGRNSNIKITPKGVRLAELLIKVDMILEED
jgi:DNA-binding PadR family transcriptional regulator